MPVSVAYGRPVFRLAVCIETDCSVKGASENDSQTWPMVFCECTLKRTDGGAFNKAMQYGMTVCFAVHNVQMSLADIFLCWLSFILQNVHTHFRLNQPQPQASYILYYFWHSDIRPQLLKLVLKSKTTDWTGKVQDTQLNDIDSAYFLFWLQVFTVNWI